MATPGLVCSYRSCLVVIDALAPTQRQLIIVSEAQIERLVKFWQSINGELPAQSALDCLVDNWNTVEVLYQQALRIGLNQQDTIVRRCLIKNIYFVTETNSQIEPDVNTLRCYQLPNIITPLLFV